MMQIAAIPVPTLAIDGSDERFPIRRIFCVGQNYADHVREMGNDPARQDPVFFSKPADALIGAGPVPFPPRTDDLHHEVELVLALGAGGVDIAPADALDLVFGVAVGIDLTRRDLQAAAKKAGRPWDMAKGFDHSAPVGPIRRGGVPASGTIELSVNGEPRQRGDLAEMIWTPAEIIATLSTYVALAPGDLIFTGTPAGVGALRRGDTATAAIEGLPPLTIEMV